MAVEPVRIFKCSVRLSDSMIRHDEIFLQKIVEENFSIVMMIKKVIFDFLNF